MQTTMAVEDLKLTLPELLNRLAPGDEVILTRNQQPVAKLVGEPSRPRQPRRSGSAKGKLIILEEDDDQLNDFEEYMG